jgi:hypothetical protein
MELSQSGFVI